MVQHSQGREFYDDGYHDNDDEKHDLHDRIAFTSGTYCGREKELGQLKNLYQNHMEVSSLSEEGQDVCPVVMVSGDAGSGKTSLVGRFVRWLERESNGGKGETFFYLSGKHEELKSDPYSAISEALGGIGSSLRNSKDPSKDMERLRTIVCQTLGDEIETLSTIVPSLAEFFGYKSKGNMSLDVENAPNRLRFALGLLTKAMNATGKPIVVFLDDLQWVDSGSLDILVNWVRTNTTENFIIVVAYRSKEVDESHPLAKARNALLKEGREIVTMHLSNLSLDGVREVISKALHMGEEDDPRLLARSIYGQTRGNPLFTIQLLQELVRRNILYFSKISFSWEWSNKGLEELEAAVPRDMLDTIVDKIACLPNKLGRVLTVASYTKSVFNRTILQTLLDGVGIEIGEKELTTLLDLAVLEGILQNKIGSQQYCFGHDMFQVASQSLLSSETDRDEMKHAIGRTLFHMVESNQLGAEDWMMFLATDHWNSVPSLVDTVSLAKANLRCGEKAMRVADFHPAASYFGKGVEAIERVRGRWEVQYDLSLRLHRGSSEVLAYLGQFETAQKHGAQVLDNARSLEDKIPTYLMRAMALGRMERFAEAYEQCCTALKLIGSFPPRGHFAYAVWDSNAVKRYLKRHSNELVLSLPEMTDSHVLSTVALFHELGFHAILCGRHREWVFASLRQIRLALKHGLCGYSPAALASYATHLTISGDMAGAERVAILAREMTSKLEDKRKEGVTLYALSVFVDDWRCPRGDVLSALRVAHKKAMAVGDFDTGFLIWCHMIVQAVSIGDPLGPIETSGMHKLDQMNQVNFDGASHILLETLFAVRALTGSLEQPIDWSNFDNYGGNARSESDRYRRIHYCMGRMCVAVHFRQFQIASKFVEYLPSLHIDGYAYVAPAMLFEGLTYSGLARQSGKRLFVGRLRKTATKMKQFMRERKCSKMLNKLRLLESELASLTTPKDTGRVKGLYDSAMQLSLQEKNLLDASLAAESAGEHFMEQGPMEIAKAYFFKAIDICVEWEATAKVDHLQRRLRELNLSELVDDASA